MTNSPFTNDILAELLDIQRYEPNNSLLLYLFSLMEYSTDNTENADAFLSAALSLNPNAPWLLRKGAEWLKGAGHEAASLELLGKALSNNLNDIRTLEMVGEHLLNVEKYEPSRTFTNARLCFSKILKLNPENIKAQKRLQEIEHFALGGYVFKSLKEAEEEEFPDFLYPKTLVLYLTTRCNIRCFICRREDFKGEDIDLANLVKVENAVRHATTIDLTGWGECFLFKDVEKVLQFIFSHNSRINLIQITSNGTLLSARIAGLLAGHLHSLTISLNAATASTYNRDMVHADFDTTIGRIKEFMANLQEIDRRKIALHFVAHTENFRELPKFVELAYELGIGRITIGNYLVGNTEHEIYSLLTVKEEFNLVIDATLELGNKLKVEICNARKFFTSSPPPPPQQCKDPFDTCFINPDGLVAGPCCFSGEEKMGNVYESSFESVWFGEKYEKLRRSRYLPACQECVPFSSFDDPASHLTGMLKADRRKSH